MIRSGKTEQRMALRARIIFHLAEGLTPKGVASELGVSTKTVRKWKRRFLEFGVDGLSDLQRLGAPPKYRVEQRLEVIAMACGSPGDYGIEGYNEWTYDILTQAVQEHVEGPKMSRTSIFRTLDEIDLKPHRMQIWLHSQDSKFREKVNDIVSLYTDLLEDAVVLCVDEKTGIQAKECKYETRRAVPGRPGRFEHEYIRHGTQSLLCSFDVRTGEVFGNVGDTRTAEDLVSFMETVALRYKKEKRIIVIWDNLNIHYDGPSNRWTDFNERHGNKFEFHYTPLHASWVNQIEIFFSILHKRCLRHGNFHSIEDLRNKLTAFIERWNTTDGHPFNWTFRGYPLQSQEKVVA